MLSGLSAFSAASLLGRYGLALGVYVTFMYSQPEPFISYPGEVTVYLRHTGPTAECHCGHRGRRQAAECLPHDIVKLSYGTLTPTSCHDNDLQQCRLIKDLA